MDELPLFPLGTVLFPGLALPLHVFEERYRLLVRELLALPEDTPRRFGVVCIRRGREVGAHDSTALYEVGCTADLRAVDELPGGRFALATVGGRRFRLHAVDHAARPYLTGTVEWLPEDVGEPSAAAELAPAVDAAFRTYVEKLSAARGATTQVPDLPQEPLALSYAVAAGAVADRAERQALLAAADGVDRLRTLLFLLRRETALVERMAAAPATQLTRMPISPN